MFFILEGSCAIIFEDRIETLQKGDVFIIPTEKAHITKAEYAEILIACAPQFDIKNVEVVKE